MSYLQEPQTHPNVIITNSFNEDVVFHFGGPFGSALPSLASHGQQMRQAGEEMHRAGQLFAEEMRRRGEEMRQAGLAYGREMRQAAQVQRPASEDFRHTDSCGYHSGFAPPLDRSFRYDDDALEEVHGIPDPIRRASYVTRTVFPPGQPQLSIPVASPRERQTSAWDNPFNQLPECHYLPAPPRPPRRSRGTNAHNHDHASEAAHRRTRSTCSASISADPPPPYEVAVSKSSGERGFRVDVPGAGLNSAVADSRPLSSPKRRRKKVHSETTHGHYAPKSRGIWSRVCSFFASS